MHALAARRRPAHEGAHAQRDELDVAIEAVAVQCGVAAVEGFGEPPSGEGAIRQAQLEGLARVAQVERAVPAHLLRAEGREDPTSSPLGGAQALGEGTRLT